MFGLSSELRICENVMQSLNNVNRITGEYIGLIVHYAAKFLRMYKVGHPLRYLGWVCLYLSYSTLCLILLGLMGNWQNLLNTWAN